MPLLNTTPFRSLIAAEAYKQQVLASNPKFYFRLEEASGNAVDEQGFMATATSGVTYQQPGAMNGSFSFLLNGANSNIAGSQTPSFLNGKSFTIEAWFKWDGNRAIANNGNDHRIMTLPRTGGATNVSLGLNEDGGAADRLAFSNNSTAELIHGTNTGIVLNTWYHTALTFNFATNEFIMYLDGSVERAYTVASALSTFSSSQAINIGFHVSISRVFSGFLDDVALYETLLSPATILAHYQAGL